MVKATDLKTASCLTINLGELMAQVSDDFQSTDETIVVPVEKVPKLITVLYDKVDESMQECFNKQLVIDFGDSVVANSLETLAQLLITVLRSQAGRKEVKMVQKDA